MTENQHVTAPDGPVADRRRRPWWAVAGVVALVLAVVGSVLTEQGMERRIADRVRCDLPEGAAVGEVDVSGWAPYALVTGSVDHVDLTLEADTNAVRALLSENAPTVSLHDGLVTFTAALRGTEVEVVVRPVVADGGVRLEPESVQVGSRTIGAGLLGGLPGLGRPDAHALSLPAPLDAAEVVALTVADDRLELAVRVHSPSLTSPRSGACA